MSLLLAAVNNRMDHDSLLDGKDNLLACLLCKTRTHTHRYCMHKPSTTTCGRCAVCHTLLGVGLDTEQASVVVDLGLRRRRPGRGMMMRLRSRHYRPSTFRRIHTPARRLEKKPISEDSLVNRNTRSEDNTSNKKTEILLGCK